MLPNESEGLKIKKPQLLKLWFDMI